MNKYREYMKNKAFTRISFSIVFTATLLYIAYFVVRDFGNIASTAATAVGSVISALAPLWIGLILAYLINPLVESIDNKLLRHFRFKKNDALPDKAEKGKKRRRFISIIISYLFIIAAIIALLYGFAALIMGELVFSNISDLFNSFLKLATNYEAEFQKWASHIPTGVFSDYAQDAANTIINWLSENFNATGLLERLTNISSGIFDFVIGIIVSIYVISDKDFLIGMWRKFAILIAPRKNNSLNKMLNEIHYVLSRFVRGVLLDALCVAILSSVGLSLIGLKFAVFIGIFAGVANVIPYFGPVLGMIPAFLVGTFTDNIWAGVIAVVVLLIVQQIDSNIIYPRVVGSSTGLKPLFVLLAVTVGGYYGGILGMIIAVPTAGIAQIFVLKWVQKREEKIQNIEQ